VVPRAVHVERPAHVHLGLLATVLIGVKAWGYQLDAYDLLYSRRGVVFGAVYADIHAALPILQGLIVLCALTALACLLFAFQAIWRPAVLTGGLTLAVATVCISLYPELVHRLQVVPNESMMERPYIAQNIKFTRLAYG